MGEHEMRVHGCLLRLLQLDQVAPDLAAAVDAVLDVFRIAPAYRARHGLRVVGEAFADRAYEVGGALRDRSLAGALIENDAQCLAQVLRIAQRGEVIAHDGSVVKIDAQTICLHSDTANAARRAAFLREHLSQHGIVPGTMSLADRSKA